MHELHMIGCGLGRCWHAVRTRHAWARIGPVPYYVCVFSTGACARFPTKDPSP